MSYIAFDIGNVLMHVDFSPFYKLMIEIFHNSNRFKSDKEVWNWMEHNEKLDFIGAISLTKLIDREFPNLIDYDKDRLKIAWNLSIYPNEKMLEFMKELKDENVKIALLSNMGLNHAEYIKEKFPDLLDVDICYLSCDIGAFKPNHLFYQSFLLSNPEYRGCLYLDDRWENIIAGERFKFNSYDFNLEELIRIGPIAFKYKLDEIRDILYK